MDLAEDQWIAGVMDIGADEDFLPTIGMREKDFYFNAGVILMNLNALGKNDFENKCAEFIRAYREAIRFVDQDVLNYVCHGHVVWVDPKYNISHLYIDNWHAKSGDKTRYHSFYGLAKTLALCLPQSTAYKYREYLRLTPWKDYRYPDKTLKNVIKKKLFFFRKFLRQIWGNKNISI